MREKIKKKSKKNKRSPIFNETQKNEKDIQVVIMEGSNKSTDPVEFVKRILQNSGFEIVSNFSEVEEKTNSHLTNGEVKNKLKSQKELREEFYKI